MIKKITITSFAFLLLISCSINQNEAKKTFNAEDLSEEYLEYVYGPHWKQPIKKYNWIKDSPSTKDI